MHSHIVTIPDNASVITPRSEGTLVKLKLIDNGVSVNTCDDLGHTVNETRHPGLVTVMLYQQTAIDLVTGILGSLSREQRLAAIANLIH